MIKTIRTLMVFVCLIALPSISFADDVYDVANIKVDAKGKDGIAAKAKALAIAESKGVVILFERLLTPGQKSRALKQLDRETRSLLVKGFSVKNEQSSGTQYIAEITIKFRRVAVQQFLNGIGAKYSDVQSSVSLLIPILTDANGRSVIWSGQNAWSDALASHDIRNSLIPLKIATSAEAGLLATEQEVIDRKQNAIFQLASAAGESADTVFAHMTLTEQNATLKVSGLINYSKKYSLANGPAATYQSAASDFLRALESKWRNNNISSKPRLAEVKALVVFGSLDQWIALRARLGQVSAIGEFDTDAMTSDGAFINIQHRGSVADLSAGLQSQGLTLIDLGGYFEIRG
ncbi:MAG: hypothetical protein COB13_003565 [OCS116 cluster bacterium]|uniref:DUF2066 domain-containing protein n=1 Tax=OCS116 cluster bacterium TaxID=2030921 RepID=A0A2A4YXE0_9PROT|nr:hypothetical protein [OCS116 cluster bacterium]